ICSAASRSVNQSECRLIRSPGAARNSARIASSDSCIIRRCSTGSMPIMKASEGSAQHPPVGHHQRVVIGQRHHSGAELDVFGALGGGGDEYLGACDEFVTAGMMFTEPRLVVAAPVQRDDALQVVLQCDRWGLTDRVKRCDENAEIQGTGHHSSNRDRNVNSASLTSSGRSCWIQCPAPSITSS